MTISCAAILCVRDESLHIRRALSDLIHQGIEVAVIDQESTDGTIEICEEFVGAGLLSIDRLNWTGVYDLTAQLKAKARIVEKLRHDWVIHTDADEWLQSPVEGETLLEGLDRISENGCNVINFEDFVFLPHHGQRVGLDSYEKNILNYYFFAPWKKRLMRAWKRSAGFQNIESGGHLLSGKAVKIAPEDFILRHYIVLSHEQAVQKYVGRIFSERDLEKNWHSNRLYLSAEALELPAPDNLKKLSRWDSVNFDRSEPRKEHYWGWSNSTNANNQIAG
jgi:glycosyltransferase involved in cell wall biosynthesis